MNSESPSLDSSFSILAPENYFENGFNSFDETQDANLDSTGTYKQSFNKKSDQDHIGLSLKSSSEEYEKPNELKLTKLEGSIKNCTFPETYNKVNLKVQDQACRKNPKKIHLNNIQNNYYLGEYSSQSLVDPNIYASQVSYYKVCPTQFYYPLKNHANPIMYAPISCQGGMIHNNHNHIFNNQNYNYLRRNPNCLLKYPNLQEDSAISLINYFYLSGSLIEILCSSNQHALHKRLCSMKEESANYLCDILLSADSIAAFMLNAQVTAIFSNMISMISPERRIKILSSISPSFQQLTTNVNGSRSIHFLLLSLTTNQEIELFIHFSIKIMKVICFHEIGSSLVINIIKSISPNQRERLSKTLISNLFSLVTVNHFSSSIVSSLK